MNPLRCLFSRASDYEGFRAAMSWFCVTYLLSFSVTESLFISLLVSAQSPHQAKCWWTIHHMFRLIKSAAFLFFFYFSNMHPSSVRRRWWEKWNRYFRENADRRQEIKEQLSVGFKHMVCGNVAFTTAQQMVGVKSFLNLCFCSLVWTSLGNCCMCTHICIVLVTTQKQCLFKTNNSLARLSH